MICKFKPSYISLLSSVRSFMCTLGILPWDVAASAHSGIVCTSCDIHGDFSRAHMNEHKLINNVVILGFMIQL